MTLEPNGPAPYTTPSSLTLVIDTFRNRSLGTPITADVLIRAGVKESLASRTNQSMKLLNLLQEDGQPTQQFEDFRLARGDDEFKARLQEWLRGVYADILQYADPSTHNQVQIAEAFRTYKPSGQREPMAALLWGLWKYAGLPVNEADNGRPERPSVARTVRTTPMRRPTPKQPPVTRQHQNVLSGGSGDLPPGLIGLLQQIPRDGTGWTKARRDNFIAAFGGVLDFSVPVLTDEEIAALGKKEGGDDT